MSEINVDLVTPEQLLFSEPANMVVLPGVEGDFGVLVGHSPVISSLRAGAINIEQANGKEQRVFVAGGFAEVTAERCTILAEQAFDITKMTLAEAKKLLEEKEDALKYAPKSANVKKLSQDIEVAKALVEHLEA